MLAWGSRSADARSLDFCDAGHGNARQQGYDVGRGGRQPDIQGRAPPSVRNPPVSGRSSALMRRSGLCQMPTLVDAAANFRFEPLTDIVCEKRDVRFVPGPDLVHRSSAQTQDGRRARWRWLTGIVFPRCLWREIIGDIVPNSLLDLVSVKPTCQPE